MQELDNYPRPQLRRENKWYNLNGIWQAEVFDSSNNLIKKGDILVPYSPEANLSGFNHILKPDETLIYTKNVDFPLPFDSEKEKLFLHFGAIDYEAEILIDGKKELSHRGGYLPFSLEVKKKSFLLTAIVKDPTDTKEQARGKQKLKRGGIWYTPSSGIWQTVWMEKVDNAYIESLKIIPTLKGFFLTVFTSISGEGSVVLDGKTYTFVSEKEIFIEIENPELWSPENPYLYFFDIFFGQDKVSSYTGLRTFSVEEDERGTKRLFLNGKSYFHHGVLDQGYYKDGLYTPPNEKQVINDLLLLKAMGFNTVRKHIKIESLRWYYLCDKLGLLVWQDMPNGGGKYSPFIISLPLVFGSHLKDNHYSLLKRKDKEMREEFVSHTIETINLLRNVTSIAMWVPFNEAWGQFDSVKIGSMIEQMDNTRTVDYASGWLDQKKGNFKSLHVYFRPYRFKKDKMNRAVILTEFGGYGLALDDHRFSSDKFEYKGYKTKEELTDAVIAMYERDIIPAKEKGLAASIYTQLSDVEDELNGLITYDREVIKMDVKKMKEMGDRLTTPSL